MASSKVSRGIRALFYAAFFVSWASLRPPSAAACDGLGCFLSKHETGENVLALMTVTDVDGTTVRAVAEHVFPRTHLFYWFHRTFFIQIPNEYLQQGTQFNVGAHYFVSLDCGPHDCQTIMTVGVNGTDYRTAKFIRSGFYADPSWQSDLDVREAFMHKDGNLMTGYQPIDRYLWGVEPRSFFWSLEALAIVGGVGVTVFFVLKKRQMGAREQNSSFK